MRLTRIWRAICVWCERSITIQCMNNMEPFHDGFLELYSMLPRSHSLYGKLGHSSKFHFRNKESYIHNMKVIKWHHFHFPLKYLGLEQHARNQLCRLHKFVDLCGMRQFITLFMLIPNDGSSDSWACWTNSTSLDCVAINKDSIILKFIWCDKRTDCASDSQSRNTVCPCSFLSNPSPGLTGQGACHLFGPQLGTYLNRYYLVVITCWCAIYLNIWSMWTKNMWKNYVDNTPFIILSLLQSNSKSWSLNMHINKCLSVRCCISYSYFNLHFGIWTERTLRIPTIHRPLPVISAWTCADSSNKINTNHRQ